MGLFFCLLFSVHLSAVSCPVFFSVQPLYTCRYPDYPPFERGELYD